MLLCLAGFLWFVVTEARREPRHHWFVVALLYGLPLAATLAIACATGAFCGGLNVISHTEITFDTQSVSFGCLFGALFFVPVCFVQIVMITILRRFTQRYWIRLCAITVPVLIGAALFCGKTAYAALPEQRFESFIGIPAPSSVTSIAYSRYTSGFFTSIRLTCRVDPKDADLILRQNTADRTVIFDSTNNVITATHAAD